MLGGGFPKSHSSWAGPKAGWGRVFLKFPSWAGLGFVQTLTWQALPTRSAHPDLLKASHFSTQVPLRLGSPFRAQEKAGGACVKTPF